VARNFNNSVVRNNTACRNTRPLIIARTIDNRSTSLLPLSRSSLPCSFVAVRKGTREIS
jgi:hypothetical protein